MYYHNFSKYEYRSFLLLIWLKLSIRILQEFWKLVGIQDALSKKHVKTVLTFKSFMKWLGQIQKTPMSCISWLNLVIYNTKVSLHSRLGSWLAFKLLCQRNMPKQCWHMRDHMKLLGQIQKTPMSCITWLNLVKYNTTVSLHSRE